MKLNKYIVTEFSFLGQFIHFLIYDHTIYSHGQMFTSTGKEHVYHGSLAFLLYMVLFLHRLSVFDEMEQTNIHEVWFNNEFIKGHLKWDQSCWVKNINILILIFG